MRKAIILTLLFVGKLYAQDYLKGYLVTTSMDTLKGQILNASPAQISKNVVFREIDGTKKQEYSPKEINSFLVGKEYYVSAEIGSEKWFLRELVSGYLQLYSFTSKRTNYCIKKDNKWFILTEKDYIQALANYCSDCKKINFSDTLTFEATYPFEKAGLSKFAYNYNMWMFNEHPIVLEKRTSSNRMKSQFGISIGAEIQNITYKNRTVISSSVERNLSNFYVPTIGVSYQRGISDGLSFQGEIIFTKVAFEYVDEDKFEKLRWDNSFQANLLRTPICLVYNFNRGKKVSPHILAGYQFIWRLNEDSNIYLKNQKVEFSTNYLWRGVIGGIGVNYRVGKISPFVQTRFLLDSVIDKISEVTTIAVVRAIHITVGVKF